MSQVPAFQANDGTLFLDEQKMKSHNNTREFEAELKELSDDMMGMAPFSDDWRANAFAESETLAVALAWIITKKPETLKNAIRLAAELQSNSN